MVTKLNDVKKTLVGRQADVAFAFRVTFIVVGVIAFILGCVRSNLAVLSAGLGFISLSLGLIAIAIAKKSDKTMEATANALFDQALSMMVDYSEQPQEWEDVFYRTRAALHLVPWANEPMKRDFKNRFIGDMRQATADGDTQLIERLEELRRQYNIDKW
jgi:hypothetical protein